MNPLLLKVKKLSKISFYYNQGSFPNIPWILRCHWWVVASQATLIIAVSVFCNTHYTLHIIFVITSLIVILFVSKVQETLEKLQQTITHLEQAKDNNAKLASLATLAAGAAHELSTPLAAIAIAAGEMYHSLKYEHEGGATKKELQDDTMFIKEQIRSCKDILYQMSSDAEQPMGEPEVRLNLALYLQEIADSYGHKVIDLIIENANITVLLPPKTFKRVIVILINNSLDACPNNEKVTLSCNVDSEKIYINIIDEGIGMDTETLARASEPFFTTKAPGKGLGLGLYLAKTLAKCYGGNLKLNSNSKGTKVEWSLSRK